MYPYVGIIGGFGPRDKKESSFICFLGGGIDVLCRLFLVGFLLLELGKVEDVGFDSFDGVGGSVVVGDGWDSSLVFNSGSVSWLVTPRFWRNLWYILASVGPSSVAWHNSFSVCLRISLHLAFCSSSVMVFFVMASCRDLKNNSWYCRRNSLSNFSLSVLMIRGGNGLCFFGIVPWRWILY